MSRPPFLYGARDTGPFDPPPWPQIVMMLMGVVIFIGSLIVGSAYEWIGGVYVRGPLAVLSISGLLFCLVFVGDGVDKGNAELSRLMEEQDEEDRDRDRD